MRTFILPLALAASVAGFASTASAADVTGTITAISNYGTVTLDNGATYRFGFADPALDGFVVGDHVMINYVDQGVGPYALKGDIISPAS